MSESLFNKAAGLRSATLLKKEILAQVFSCEFVKFLRTLFCIEHLWWLLLSFGLPKSIPLKKDDAIEFGPRKNVNIFKVFYSELARNLVRKVPVAPNNLSNKSKK